MNNFFEDIAASAINSRMGAHVLVEGNYFLRTGSGNVDGHDGQIEGRSDGGTAATRPATGI